MTKLIKRIVLDLLGILLILGGVAFGWLPGPGGIPLILAGLGLLSINNVWAKRVLQNFEDIWKDYQNKITHSSPRIQNTIDIFVALSLGAGVILAFQKSAMLLGFGIGMIISALILGLTNRDRVTKLKNLF